MSWKGIFQKAGFLRPDGVNLTMRGRFSAGNISDTFGKHWYVSRNVSASGDGKVSTSAFLTITEAVAAVNADYTAGRKTQYIHVDEGWYSEPTITLTASDCYIIGEGAGGMARTVLYGSLTAGGWDDGNLGPALAITGWNNTIENIDFVNRSAVIANPSGGVTALKHPCIQEGTFLVPVAYNKYVNCVFMRDQPDAASWGILSYSMDHTLIEGCVFNGRSLTNGGIGIAKMTGNNHSADIIRGNYFFGCPDGVFQAGGHNTMIHDNYFTNQGANGETMTNATNIVAHSANIFNNFALDINLAQMEAGGGGTNLGNICADSDNADWPEGG